MMVTLWEIALVAFCVLCGMVTAYLLGMIKRLTSTIESINSLVGENSARIGSILENVDRITVDARDAVDKVGGAVSGVSGIVSTVKEPVTPKRALDAKKAFEYASFAVAAVRFLSDQRRKAKRRKERRESSKAA
jgi:uncharacterized protein YoxC